MPPSRIASCSTSACKNFAENRERAFAEYFRRRKENADALADLAIGNFHRDARQDCVENISREKETGSRAGSRTARNVSAALYDGHFHKNPVRKSSEAGADPGCVGVCELISNGSRLGCGDALVIRRLSNSPHSEIALQKSSRPIYYCSVRCPQRTH